MPILSIASVLACCSKLAVRGGLSGVLSTANTGCSDRLGSRLRLQRRKCEGGGVAVRSRAQGGPQCIDDETATPSGGLMPMVTHRTLCATYLTGVPCRCGMPTGVINRDDAEKNGVSEISINALFTITEMKPPSTPPPVADKHTLRATQPRVVLISGLNRM